MKTIEELAAERFEGPDSLKRRAVGLRRLCGGLSAEATRANDTGLTDKELRILTEAAGILSTMAARYDGARKTKQKSLDAIQAMQGKVHEAMKGTFAGLTSVPDQVAFVAMIGEYQLRNLSTLADLYDAMRENTDYVTRCLAEQSLTRRPEEVVAEAWGKFQAVRCDLQSRHAATIGRLTADA